jgi:DNA-binding transcriptional regulator YhcF (GntR family)
MAEKKDKYIDKSGDKKYFAMIPYYIANHSSAYEQSLYLVMKRIASEEGTCWASPSELAKRMRVSSNTVRKNIKKLIGRGWIRKVSEKQVGKTGQFVNEYELTNLWKRNVEYIETEVRKSSPNETLKSSPGELKVSPGESKSSPGGSKEETIKNNKEEYIRLDKPTVLKRKDKTFPAELYKLILDKYQELKGIALRGKEFDAPMQDIKSMFLSERKPSEIISFMGWLAEKSENEDKKWDWVRNWTIKTVRLKIPEFLAGKLQNGEEDFKVPDYAKDYKKNA